VVMDYELWDGELRLIEIINKKGRDWKLYQE
jgi:hypothetical protein